MTEMKNKLTYLKKLFPTVGVCFLFTFMLFVFSPAETFFANAAELQFVYGSFAYYLILLAVVTAVIVGAIVAILPAKVHKVAIGLMFSLSVGSYIQNMFLNKGLDLMGLHPEGYVPDTGKIVTNAIIWVVVIAVIVFLTIRFGTKPMYYAALFLGAIQMVALVSLYINADKNCFAYPDTEYHLSGAEQYKVSSGDNIVLFILDSFSYGDLKNALEQDPTALDPFCDFTFYNNMDSVYCGTYPSLIHMFTNADLDMSLKVDEWARQSWTSEKANYFYDAMKEKEYHVNLYTPDTNIICGLNPTESLLDGKISNFTNEPQKRVIDYDTIRRTMRRMAAYRMSPTFMKNAFYVNLDEYYDAVTVVDDPMMHENFDFYSKLMEQGLTLDESGQPYYSIQHLMGTHLFENDEYGNYKEDATPMETALGCLNLVNEYMNEMKRLGVYDSSTIIVTADHGVGWGQFPIFFIKQPFDSNDEIYTYSAPVTFCELLPTIAQAAGIDSEPIGETIYDYSEGNVRTRTLWIRDYKDDYPNVPCYYGDKVGTANVYIGYTYEGDEQTLLTYLFDKFSQIVPMVDSYF